MYFWNSYPFVRISIALILGIIIFDYYPEYWEFPILSLGVLLSFLLLLVYMSHKSSFYSLRHFNGLVALLSIFFFGGLISKIHYHSLSQNHYSRIESRMNGFSGTIVSAVNERTNHFRYDFQLGAMNSKDSIFNVEGTIHLYVRKDTAVKPLTYGDQILVKGSFYSVPGPDNPNEFDYKKYLERQNIYAHAFVTSNDIKIVENHPSNYLLKWAYFLREKAGQIIDRNIVAPRENAIAKALLLGIKDHLDNDIKKAYSSAGAMHVLAVSGLHVGIIFLILRIFLGKLRDLGRSGKLAFGLITVTLIWLYAMVTGLSPSVLRAATMFSLIAISQANSREGNIYNTLGFAAFVLLIYDPYLIYSVGFQLSFIAVIGIVYLQPKLYRLFDFRIWLLDKAWSITCVSIAAQLATFPLSAYYFHQFPTYFLASNLIVIPAAFLMLIGGIAIVLIDPIASQLGELIGTALYHFMWLVNEIISRIELLPNSLIEWLYMDQVGLILTYAIVISLIAGLHFRSFQMLVFTSLLGSLFIGWTIKSNVEQTTREQLIFYEIKGRNVIDYISGHDSRLFIDKYSPEDLELLSFQINPNRLASHLQPISKSIQSFSDALFYKKESLSFGEIANKKILFIDSTTFHLTFDQPIKADILVINNGSVKSIEWLTRNAQVDQLVIGNINSSYYSRKMKKQAAELDISLHSLKEDGALIINLK